MPFEKLAGVGYGEGWIQLKGGVAWAKQVAANLDPGAVGDQITAYQQAANQTAHAQKVLKNTQGNLDVSWSGQAATAAQQTFQGAINHAQLIQDTINQDIVPHLQAVQQAQRDYIDAMTSVPNEKPLTSEAVQYLWTKSFITYPSNYPGRVLVEHNTAARTQAATALTALTGKYNEAATQLSGVADMNRSSSTSSTSTFNLGTVSPVAGNGAAANYRQSLRPANSASRSTGTSSSIPGVTPPGRVTTTGGGTQLASSGPSGGNPPSRTLTPNPVQSPVPAASQPPEILPIGSQLPGAGGYGEQPSPVNENVRGGATEFGSDSSDGQTTGGTGTGSQRGTMGDNDGESLVEPGRPAAGENAAADAVEGESPGGLVAEGTGALGGLGAGSGADGRRSGSSRYTRGRYFDEPADEQPSLPSVRSVFEDATDEQGNSLNLLSGRRASGRDKQGERGKRPPNPKEDRSWDSARRIVPPVIE